MRYLAFLLAALAALRAISAEDDPVAPWRQGVRVAPVSAVEGRHTIHTCYLASPESPDRRRVPDLPVLRGMHASVSPDARLMATDGMTASIGGKEKEWGVVSDMPSLKGPAVREKVSRTAPEDEPEMTAPSSSRDAMTAAIASFLDDSAQCAPGLWLRLVKQLASPGFGRRHANIDVPGRIRWIPSAAPPASVIVPKLRQYVAKRGTCRQETFFDGGDYAACLEGTAGRRGKL